MKKRIKLYVVNEGDNIQIKCANLFDDDPHRDWLLIEMIQKLPQFIKWVDDGVIAIEI